MMWLLALALVGIGLWNLVVGLEVWAWAIFAMAFMVIVFSVKKAVHGD